LKGRRLKNQLMITALVLMIAVGGFLSFHYKDKGLLKTAMGGLKKEDGKQTTELEDMEDAGEAVATSGSAASDYAAGARLKREQSHAKVKEELNKLLKKSGISKEEKKEITKKLVLLTTNQDAETAIENILEAKGFQNVVVSVGEEGVDVVVDLSVVEEKDLSKIQEVVNRKTKCPPEKIVVTPLRVE